MLVLPGWAEALRTQRTKRLAVCYRIELLNGDVKRYTTHNARIITRAGPPPLATAEYTPVASPSPQAERKTAGVAPQNTTIFGPTAFTGMDPEDLRIGLYDGAELLKFVVDWRYPWAGPLRIDRYFISSVTWSGERWEMEMRSIASRFDKSVGRIHSRRCDAQLGDERCTVDLSLMGSGTKTVTAVDGFTAADKRLRFHSSLTTPSDKWWTDGNLQWLTGNNAILGLNQYQVKKYVKTNGEFELYVPTKYDIQVGDTFKCDPGCGKDAQHDCRKKFDNIVNHRGFPYMRGSDHIVRTPDAK